MNYKSKFSFGEWNIGFIDPSFDLLKDQKLSVNWMKHGYKTCGFADPFLYNVTDTIFEVFAEDKSFIRAETDIEIRHPFVLSFYYQK